jgi:hypothetical protein
VKRAVVLVLLLCLASPAGARERYDPQTAGHPVRIAAYALHPVGYLLDRLIFYPAWVIGSWRPIAVLVGHEIDPPELVVTPQPQP